MSSNHRFRSLQLACLAAPLWLVGACAELDPELTTETAELAAGPYATVTDPVCAPDLRDSWTRVMMTPGSPGLLNVSFNGVPLTQLSRLRLNSPPRWGAGTWTVYSTATRLTYTVEVKQDLSCVP